MKKKYYILAIMAGIGAVTMLCRRKKFWLEMRDDTLVKSRRRGWGL